MSDVYVCMNAHVGLGGRGGGGGGVWGIPPRKFIGNLMLMRLLLSPFWDRSRAVV